MTRTLWGALGEVPDRRGLQGQQYKLQSLLGSSIGAMLAGGNDLRAATVLSKRIGKRTRVAEPPVANAHDGFCHNSAVEH